ncbi:hypothetical protein V2G26_009046 [Clonostachys chloroleuca]
MAAERRASSAEPSPEAVLPSKLAETLRLKPFGPRSSSPILKRQAGKSASPKCRYTQVLDLPYCDRTLLSTSPQPLPLIFDAVMGAVTAYAISSQHRQVGLDTINTPVLDVWCCLLFWNMQ